jgi:hypothetical protein
MSVPNINSSKRSSVKNNGALNFGFSENDENLYGKERSRPVFTAKYLESAYKYDDNSSENILKGSFNYVKKYYMPNADNCKAFIRKKIPLVEWIPEYDFKQNLVKDLIGGITVIF